MIGGAKGIGLGIDLGLVNQYNRTGSQSYIEPEVLDSLVGVWSAYGMTNDSPNRSTIKNKLSNKGGDFVISNAAFKLNSGFGKYETELSNTRIWTQSKETTSSPFSSSYNGLSGWTLFANTPLTNSADMPSFKIQVKGLLEGQELIYRYYDSNGQSNVYSMGKDGEYTLPADIRTAKPQTSNTSGFQVVKNDTNTITITQIPSFVGAFVTDGVNDLITSTKTVQEMLGGSNEITVVSMMANLDSRQILCNSNYSNTNGYNVRNTLEPNGVISMLGYTDKNGTTNNINLIMGDKNSIKLVDKVNFNSDYVFYPAQYYKGYYQVAWYWTFIAKKALTTDQINQVIAYFNLDRTLKPDILCNIEKQGITNENHAEFGDKLIDFSGNGRDIQLNNIAWDGDSGIGKYNYPNWKVTATIANTYSTIVNYPTVNGTYSINVNGVSELMQSIGLHLEIKYTTSTGIIYNDIKQDGVYSYILPDGATNLTLRFGGIPGIVNEPCNITITQIPSHAGALCLDGVNDFGKVTGMPIYKDYTIVVDYERISGIEQAWAETLISKSYIANQGAFVLMETNGTAKHSYSFGAYTTFNKDDSTRTLLYQSKYKCGDVDLNVGTGIDGDTLWLGTYRDNYSSFFNGAIYSLMSFPYSMSEFLIERQLKKHKLGTLYPDMVEFRPVIKSNASYDNIVFYYKNEKVENGTYLTVGSSIGMHTRLSSSPVNEIKSITVNGIPATFKIHDANNNIYQYDFNLTSKSPQKINITIDEYIRFEDIVQPYPSLFTLIDYDTEEVYSWGSKLKVGARFKGNVVNLLPNMYEWQGNVLYNGEVLNWNINPGVVAKEMVFSWNMPFKYLIDNNEPKCILSPRLLRIPNSSYKILGYIPDISGHGNNGVIHNSAYAEGSGVNEDGSYQFDGIDDFVTIPTTVGGKQVLMKVNWQNKAIGSLIYDQRDNSSTTSFAIMPISIRDTTNNRIAYQAKNANGITYIDGIRNEYIESYSLENIIHNITITNPDVSNKTVALGASNRTTADYFAKYVLYDFMLFDEISTDDKIKELNEYVGVEAKVELPPYYWDAYGKTNSDDDRSTIQQRGTAVGDYDITNYNHAYEGMSGYNGYPAVFGTNKTYANLGPNDGNFILTSSHNIINVTKFDTSYALLYSHIKLDGKLTSRNIDYPSYKIKVTGLGENFGLHYSYLKSSSDTTVKGFEINNDGIYIIPKSFASDGSLTSNSDWIGFIFTGTAPESCNVTIEVLPEYENGLVYDGVNDYSKNANIPVLTDYTYIYKRTIINIPTNAATLLKGADKTNGSAFIADYGNKWQFNFGQYNTIQGIADGINWQTVNSFNGISINKGENTDDSGITVAKFSNGYTSMVFYKLILYPKTISLLEINFLKNLMERDEIIDLNNPIFIQE